MKKLALLLISALGTIAEAQTVSVALTVTAQASDGGSCVAGNKTPGSTAFTLNCGSNAPVVYAAPATAVIVPVSFSIGDLVCIGIQNATATAALNMFGIPNFNVAAGGVGFTCTSASNPATKPQFIALP